MSGPEPAELHTLISDMHARRTRRLRVQAWAWLTRTPVPWWRAFGCVADPCDPPGPDLPGYPRRSP